MDAFGSALRGYQDGDLSALYTEIRDDGFTENFNVDIWFTNEIYPTEKMAEKYIKGTILDIGCGAGRHLLRYQSRGFKAIGIDFSKLALSVCIDRGCKNLLHLDVLNSEIPLKNIDTVILFGNNIGLSGSISGAIHMLQTLRKVVSSDGLLFLDSIDVSLTNREVHKKYIKNNLDKGLPKGLFKGSVKYRTVESSSDWLFLSPEEITRISQLSGWKICKESIQSDGSFEMMLRPV